MTAKKYLKLDDSSKSIAEEQATVTSAGAADEGKIVALDAAGKLDDTVMPDGIGANTIVLPASEALAANDVVNIYDDTGTTKTRKANATNATKPAHGYVKASVESGSNATVYLDGSLPGTGLTIGSSYFLSATGGLVTATPPSTTGNVWQKIGNAIDDDKIEFKPEDSIVRA